MDLTTMITLARRDLHDEEEASYRFTDDELTRHLQHAVKDFSESIPLEQTASVETEAGSRDIDVSGLTGRVAIEAVEYPAGKFPKCFRRFSLWADTLTLLDDVIPDGSDACVYYGGLHTLDEESSTVSEMYEDLIATGAAGYAVIEYAAFSINRVNTGGTASASDFLTFGKEQLAIFRREIKRLGRRNRVRVRNLYTPWDAPVSKTVVEGPWE